MDLKIEKIAYFLRKSKCSKNIINNNYEKLICFFENLLINNFENLENKNFKKVNNELFKIIFEKMQKEKRLSVSEANVFFYTLYFYALEFLGLDAKKIYMQFIYPDEQKLNSNCNGVHKYKNNKHYIYYDKSILEEICESTDDGERKLFMNTIIHELVHAKQTEDLNSRELSLNAYIISLEKIVKRNGKYYKKNYDYTKLETDAKDRAQEILIKILYAYKLIDKNMFFYLEKESLYYSNKLDAQFCNHRIEYMGNEVKNGFYLLLESKEILSEHKRLFKKYPLLIFSHYPDGKLKDYNKLLEDREMFMRLLGDDDVDNYERVKLEIDSIYNYLFECYGELKLESMSNNVKRLVLSK